MRLVRQFFWCVPAKDPPTLSSGAPREASHEDAIVRAAGRSRSGDATIHKEFRLPLRRLTFDVLERQGRRCGKTPCRRADGCDPFRASRCGVSNRIRPDRAGTASRSGRPKVERARAPRGYPGSSRRTEIRRTETRGPGERVGRAGCSFPRPYGRTERIRMPIRMLRASSFPRRFLSAPWRRVVT